MSCDVYVVIVALVRNYVVYERNEEECDLCAAEFVMERGQAN